MHSADERERNRALVASLYDCASRGDLAGFVERLAEDFELIAPDFLPWGGHSDKQRYISLLPEIAATLDFARLRFLSLTAEEGHVVALVEIGLQGTETSVLISEHWDIADGKAVRVLVAYYDPRPLLTQLGLAVF